MKRIRMMWVAPILLLALSIVAIGLSHTKEPEVQVAETSGSEIDLWFSESGVVHLNGQLIEPSIWRDRWSRALSKDRKTPVRIGADENIPYALVHEAYAEAWKKGFHDAGYAFDLQGHFVALSELTRNILNATRGNPVIIEMNIHGQMTWQGSAVDERQLDGIWSGVEAAIHERNPYEAFVELKIDPLTPYGNVRRMLAILSKGPGFRVATYEESEIIFHTWFPLPPLPRAEVRGDPAMTRRR